MRFHFLLTNHYPFGCYKIEDIVVPIAAGLAELGHTVTYGFDDDVPPWPAVNLVVEFFNDPAVVDQMARLRGSAMRYCFGMILYEDWADASVMDDPNFPDRRRNLERALALVDFAWTTIPCDYSGLKGGERAAFLEYGYVAGLRRDSVLPKDIDVLFYGDLGPRRVPLFNALIGRGLSVSATFGLLPEYVKFDLLDRAKVVADVGRREDLRFLSPTRLIVPLHGGLSVVSEHYDRGPLAKLYRYTVGGSMTEFLDLCVTIARSPQVFALGTTAREAFAKETSMAANLQATMTGGVFAELAAA